MQKQNITLQLMSQKIIVVTLKKKVLFVNINVMITNEQYNSS